MPVLSRISSLEWKLTFLLFALALAISSTLAIYLPAHQSARLRADLDRKAMSLGRLTSQQVESAIAFGDRETAREVFDAVMLDPDVAGLTLLRDDGRAFASAGTMAPVDRSLGGASGPPRLLSRSDVVRVAAPVASKEGPRGVLVVDLSLASLEAERTALFRTAASVGTVTLLLGSLAAWLIARSVAFRVKRLAVATTRVADGDLAYPVLPDPSQDEIGQLARAFQHMVASIQSLVAQIADRAKEENERLETLVAARTKALDERNRAMSLVLDHVGQGFLTVDADGVMSSERSRVLDTWIGSPPVGSTFGDYIGTVDPRVGLAFASGWSEAREDVLPLELIIDQLPKTMRRGGRHLELAYTSIGDEPSRPSLLVVVSDVTAVVEQQRAEDGRRDLANLFTRVIADRTAVVEFFEEADGLVQVVDGTTPSSDEDLRRALHTLKGNASLMGLFSVGRLCHELEDRIELTGAAPTGADLASLTQAWGEISIASRSLLGERTGRLEIDQVEYQALVRAAKTASRDEWLTQLERLTLEPTSRRLDRIAEQARALADRLGKPGLQVVLEPNGVRLPSRVWAPFWSAFVHVVRNAVDHGIEGPAERAVAGKNESGTLVVRTSLVASELVIELADDGGGIDWDALGERARRAGCPATTKSEIEASLFSDGVSTADGVTDTSGRGVGLGAVRAACHALGGSVAITSRRGLGTSFQFRFPMVRTRVSSPSGESRIRLSTAALAVQGVRT